MRTPPPAIWPAMKMVVRRSPMPAPAPAPAAFSSPLLVISSSWAITRKIEGNDNTIRAQLQGDG